MYTSVFVKFYDFMLILNLYPYYKGCSQSIGFLFIPLRQLQFGSIPTDVSLKWVSSVGYIIICTFKPYKKKRNPSSYLLNQTKECESTLMCLNIPCIVRFGRLRIVKSPTVVRLGRLMSISDKSRVQEIPRGRTTPSLGVLYIEIRKLVHNLKPQYQVRLEVHFLLQESLCKTSSVFGRSNPCNCICGTDNFVTFKNHGLQNGRQFKMRQI